MWHEFIQDYVPAICSAAKLLLSFGLNVKRHQTYLYGTMQKMFSYIPRLSSEISMAAKCLFFNLNLTC